ncbi:superoxide dismutase [Methylocucumis oryzae]|uniref:superoxide dismutase n=1 Tax=Methylocucumis oryzae TaxID=1632867 RepID=A0A0F3IFS4_9GAMM|nr:Fe-Mn family superoxide dismutase [Methylocucumis oryzae]KJV05645.1 superoxide dismutase [Methylocucumis oryzae]
MTTIDRREFLTTTSGALALAAFATDTNALTSTGTLMSTQPSAFSSIHERQALPFNPSKLDGLSEKLILSHWENNYGGSVKALNTVKQKLLAMQQDANLPAFIYNDLKREHLMRTGSVVLHELYFGNLGGHGKADTALQKALTDAFGSLATWEQEFKRMGAGLGGGSGWVVLGYNLHSGLLENYWQWDHLHAPSATLPLLVMDMYEHSYQMDYGAGAAQYIDAFWLNIHWDTVSTRLDKALKMREVWLAGGAR